MRKGTKRKTREAAAAKGKKSVEEEKEIPVTQEEEGSNKNDPSATESVNKEEEEQQEPKDNNEKGEPSKNGVKKRQAKRARIAKPETETEYFPDKRNLEDLWQEVFPVGTEWDQLDMVYQYKWNFSNLEDALEEGGELHGKKVYLFGCTEPQLLFFQGQSKVTCVPVVVAVVSPFPPSDKIGIKSVQRETEEIIPMKQMKMDWCPYIPLEKRESQVERLKSEIFILRCTQRRAGLKHMKLERVKKFEYCLPYFYQPFAEDEFEQSTIVQILFPTEPPIFCEFDWEFDEPEEMADKFIESEELAPSKKDEFVEFVKENVREGKKSNREAREARKKAREEMSEEKKAAFESMQFYKFYPMPSPDAPDVSQVKSPFINRYYGKAHKVF